MWYIPILQLVTASLAAPALSALQTACMYEHCSAHFQCRSEHFPEFFQAAKGALDNSAHGPQRQPQSMPNEAQEAADAQGTDPLSALQGNPDPVMSSNLTQPTAHSAADADAASTEPAQPDTAQQPPDAAANDSSAQAEAAQQQSGSDRQHAHAQASTSGRADLQVRFADVGCGFGGLLVRLSPLYPDTLMVGMEIRDKVRPPRCAAQLLLGLACSLCFASLWLFPVSYPLFQVSLSSLNVRCPHLLTSFQ